MEKNKSSSFNNETLAPLPPMGWNSWNAFGKKVNQDAVLKTAEAMVKLGLKDLGYEYVVIDDHWHGGRDSDGYLYCHPEKFPDGIKALADAVHGLGLKFGIYSCAGCKTCGEEPGSFGYEEKDAEKFAEWHVDFLKYDYCFAPEYYVTAINRYKAMSQAIINAGRPMLYSICEWGVRSPWLWGKDTGGHMWRISHDVCDVWDSAHNRKGPIGILNGIDAMADLESFTGPGGWNDPDMLITGLRGKGPFPARGAPISNTRHR